MDGLITFSIIGFVIYLMLITIEGHYGDKPIQYTNNKQLGYIAFICGPLSFTCFLLWMVYSKLGEK